MTHYNNAALAETNVVELTTQENETNVETQTVSLVDYAAAKEDDHSGPLETVRFSLEPKFLVFFTGDAVPIDHHFLEADENLPKRGYYKCLGEECPACKAQIERRSSFLIPVVDLDDCSIKVLRVPKERGNGKLVTELGPVLSLPDPSKTICVISRDRNFKYSIKVQENETFQADVAPAIKNFKERLEAGEITLSDVIETISTEEMAAHSKITNRLKFGG